VTDAQPPERRKRSTAPQRCTADYTADVFDDANAGHVPGRFAPTPRLRVIINSMGSSNRDSAESDQVCSSGESRLARWLVGGAVLLGGAAAINAAIAYRTPPLPNPFGSGDAKRLSLPEGDVWYTVAGSGPPLVLIHSIGAGCSSFEWHRVLERLADSHTVFALDLPGFGKSDRPDVAYDSEYYMEVIELVCDRVVAPHCPDQSVGLIAVSLSAAWALVLAQRRPKLISRLALVSPVGIGSLTDGLPAGRILGNLMKVPILGQSIRNAITSRRAIQATLTDRVFANPDRVVPEIVDHFHKAAHQPGSGDVLAHFVNGDLSVSASNALQTLPIPVLFIFGAGRQNVEAGDRGECRRVRPDAQFVDIDTSGALPHLEQPDLFLNALGSWLTRSSPADGLSLP